MKAIKTSLIITSISSKSDKSLRLSAVTPEMSTEERSEFMNLQDTPLEALLQPQGMRAELLEIDKEAGSKSPSQRLRNTLYVYWKQRGEHGDFDTFYKQKMEGLINLIKGKLI